MKQINFEVLSEDADSRIDRYLAQQMPDQSRSFLQKLIREEQITVNGRPVKANYRLQPEDQVLVIVPDPQLPDILPENIPLDILYEDSDVLVINKPKGMVVHPAAGHYTNTVVNAVMYHCQGNLSGINGVMRPGIVHRIDRDTTGAIVICKNDQAHQSLAQQLKEHSITRSYRWTGRKWRSTKRTARRRLPTTGCWSGLAVSHTSNAVWKQAVPIRSAFTWHLSVTRCWEMRSMDLRESSPSGFRGSACMP